MKPVANFLPVLTALFCVSVLSGRSQVPPSPGLYEITAGDWEIVGGIWGVWHSRLPTVQQAFVRITNDPARSSFRLAVLNRDKKTEFWAFDYGFAAGADLRFYYPTDFSGEPALLDYVASMAGGRLHLNGRIESWTHPCCDIPYLSWHSNVVAVAVPSLSIRVADCVELAWDAQPNLTYQVQFQLAPGKQEWLNLGEPITASESVCRMSDLLAPDAPARYYRVIVVPE